jgi:SAM-dependent methyltransferase
MGDATDWTKFHVDVIPRRTFYKRNLIHLSLLRAALVRAQGAVLEVGVGSGAQSALLSRLVKRVVTVDNDARIMRVARCNLATHGADALTVSGDAFDLPFAERSFGTAVSQGLFEHFDDSAIARLLAEQLRVCRSVVFSVPSHNYPRQDVGNERLMPPARWSDIVRAAVGDAYTVRAAPYFLDLEASKYSLRAKRWLGSFSVLVTVDPLRSG